MPHDSAAFQNPYTLALDRLANASAVDLIGLVDANYAGGGSTPGDQEWMLSFGFAAWRIAGGPVQHDALRALKLVSHDELSDLMDKIQPYAILRARASIDEKTPDTLRCALLESITNYHTADAELRSIADELQKPVTHHDPTLGTFTLDRSLGHYEGTVQWKGQPVKLHLELEQPGDLQRAIDAARQLWKDQHGWQKRVQDFAVQKLLPLKNDNWLDDDEAPLSAATFTQRMRLETIAITPDGHFTFWHNDGDLFWGHSIQISGTLTSGPTDADIPG